MVFGDGAKMGFPRGDGGGPVALNFGGRKRSGAFDTVWPSANGRLRGAKAHAK